MSGGVEFVRYGPSDAPPGSVELLREVESDFGMIPNLERTLAVSPRALEGYVRLWGLFARSTLSPVEQQVVYQAANTENGCRYCVPWHTQLSREAGMEEEDVAALREGTALGGERLEALRRFAAGLVAGRGRVPEATRDRFFAAGYSREQAFEVVLGLATKVMSNYANAIADTPLDGEVAALAWEKPGKSL